MTDHKINLTKNTRRVIRWYLLGAINAMRPTALSEVILLDVARDVSSLATLDEVRKDLDMLEESKLIRVVKPYNGDPWMCELTSDGIAVVEYEVACPPGINRPPRV